jgi:type-F conjugative transfer system pilin assembly protein TrbC
LKTQLFVSLLLIALSSASFADPGTDEISAIRQKAKKDAAHMTLPANDYEALGRIKAEEAYKLLQSEEYLNKIARERERIQKEVFGREGVYYKDSTKGSAAGGLGTNERIYIFLSSSVPTETLRRYTSVVGALGDRNVRFVMRGFIGGMKYMRPTLAFVKDLLFEDPGCNPAKTTCATYATNVIIDPLLFSRYQVTQVPAFVYARVTPKDPDKSEGIESTTTVSAFHKVYGDVNFAYVLEAFEKETHSPGVNALLTGLRKGFYKP